MIQSIDKAIAIINIIATTSHTAPTLKYIAEKTGFNKSTCSHIIDTLIDNAVIVKISASKGYALGPQVFVWTKNNRYLDGFINILEPVLKWLNKKTGKSVTAAMIINNKKYVIDYYQSDVIIRSDNSKIFEDNFYNSATGMQLLANLSNAEIHAVFKKQGLPDKEMWPNVNSYQDLLKLLSKIKEKKVVKSHIVSDPITRDNATLGYSCIIFKNSLTYGAIGLSCLEKEINDDPKYEDWLISHLTKAAKEVSKRLENGYEE